MKYIHKEKDIEVGFIVLNIYSEEQTRKTVQNINNYFSDVTTIIISSKKLSNFKNVSYTNSNDKLVMLNNGMQNLASEEWNLFIFGGTLFKPYFLRKLSCFIESDKDILFPVLDRRTNFLKSNLNGLLMHKKAIQNGKFPIKFNHELAKLFWFGIALENNFNFKGIVGTRLAHTRKPSGNHPYANRR